MIIVIDQAHQDEQYMIDGEEQADAQDDANGGQDVDEKELGGEETSDKQVTLLH